MVTDFDAYCSCFCWNSPHSNNLSRRNKERVQIVFFISTVPFEPTFGRCKNSTTVKCFLTGISYLKTDVWPPSSNMARPKIWKNFMGTILKTYRSKCFVFGHSILFQRIARRPKKIVLEMGWTWVTGSTWDFSDAKHSSHKLRKFDATWFCWVSKKTLLQQLQSCCCRWRIRKSCLWDKNTARLCMNFFVFSQWPEVSWNSIVTIQSMRNDVR